MFIDNKFTQDTFEKFNWEVSDVTLQCIPVDDMFVQFMFVDYVLVLFTPFVTKPPRRSKSILT